MCGTPPVCAQPVENYEKTGYLKSQASMISNHIPKIRNIKK